MFTMVVFGQTLLVIGVVSAVTILWLVGMAVMLIGLSLREPGPRHRKAKAPLPNHPFSLILGRCSPSHRLRRFSYTFVSKTI